MTSAEIYSLALELAENPELIATAQALTLDTTRSYIGLRGRHGLFGSDEWWCNIESGVIPSMERSGVIQRVYTVGHDTAP